MALGGGLFSSQNKVLPGTYINFVSMARAGSALSDRGFVAVPVELDWGEEGKVFTVTNSEFEENTQQLFGYIYDAKQLKPIRDLFKHAKTVHFYRINSGAKAANTIAAANCSGIRGNDIKISIQSNVDEADKFDVITYLDSVKVDSQTVAQSADLKPNVYVTFKSGENLAATVGLPLTGGINKTEMTGEDYQRALTALEPYSFNILICPAMDEVIKNLFAAYTKRLRDECGVKFQTVIYNCSADYHGVINLKNKVLDEGAKGNELVYWLGGAQADCAVNKTLTNAAYDGEYEPEADATQSELILSIKSGELCFHKVGNEVHVLEDINSFVTFAGEMNADFALNQIVRVLDQYGNDIAAMFNKKYLGSIPNDADGRASFWGDLDNYNKKMQSIRAITNYSQDEVTVTEGDDKRSIVVTNPVQPVCAMEKCYMTIYVQ